jgi:hypothetical protein
MAKRKAEELGGDVKGDKKAKTEKEEKKVYWVITVEKGRVEYRARGVGECEVKTSILDNKLYHSESAARIEAIRYHVENSVTPKRRRELGVHDDWEEESYELLVEYLDKLNEEAATADGGEDTWETLTVIECHE